VTNNTKARNDENFAKFVTNRSYAARGGVFMAIGMTALCAVPSATHTQGVTAVAGGSFRNLPFIAQFSQFMVEFDARPTGTGNAGVGLSDDPTGFFSGTSVFVRFNPSGKITLAASPRQLKHTQKG
jgi:hypothetical protein